MQTQTGSPPTAARAVLDELDVLAADHRPCHVRFIRLSAVEARRHTPAAHHGDAVGHADDLAQLVRDKHNGRAVFFQLIDDREQLVRLLRGQYGGRLVEDQHARAEVKRLYNLDLLPLADTKAVDRCVRGDLLHSEPCEKRADLCARRPVVDKSGGRRRMPKDDILGDAHAVDLHEVLMHHADAAFKRARHAVGALFAVDEDASPVRRVLAVKNPHQRCFACAVFAHQRMRLPLVECEIDTLVGGERPESLCDRFHPDNWVHFEASFAGRQGVRPKRFKDLVVYIFLHRIARRSYHCQQFFHNYKFNFYLKICIIV